jgi:hypothetical protein
MLQPACCSLLAAHYLLLTTYYSLLAAGLQALRLYQIGHQLMLIEFVHGEPVGDHADGIHAVEGEEKDLPY